MIKEVCFVLFCFCLGLSTAPLITLLFQDMIAKKPDLGLIMCVLWINVPRKYIKISWSYNDAMYLHYILLPSAFSRIFDRVPLVSYCFYGIICSNFPKIKTY